MSNYDIVWSNMKFAVHLTTKWLKKMKRYEKVWKGMKNNVSIGNFRFWWMTLGSDYNIQIESLMTISFVCQMLVHRMLPNIIGSTLRYRKMPIMQVGFLSHVLCRGPLIPCYMDGSDRQTIPHLQIFKVEVWPCRLTTRHKMAESFTKLSANMWMWKFWRGMPRPPRLELCLKPKESEPHTPCNRVRSCMILKCATEKMNIRLIRSKFV